MDEVNYGIFTFLLPVMDLEMLTNVLSKLNPIKESDSIAPRFT